MKLKVILVQGTKFATTAQAQMLPPDFTLFRKTTADSAGEAYQFKYSLSTNGNYLFPQSGPWGSNPVYLLQGVNPALPREPGLQTYLAPLDFLDTRAVNYQRRFYSVIPWP